MILFYDSKNLLKLKVNFKKILRGRQFFIKFLKISFFKHKRHWFHYICTSYLPFSLRLHHPSFIISTLVPFTLFFTVVVVALVFVCLCRYKFNLSDAEKKTFPLNVITSRSIWFDRFSVKWMKLFVHESENNDDDGGLTEVKWNWERERSIKIMFATFTYCPAATVCPDYIH